jgi:hypothetical protein
MAGRHGHLRGLATAIHEISGLQVRGLRERERTDYLVLYGRREIPGHFVLTYCFRIHPLRPQIFSFPLNRHFAPSLLDAP